MHACREILRTFSPIHYNPANLKMIVNQFVLNSLIFNLTFQSHSQS